MTKEELELALRREKALSIKLQRMIRDLITKFKRQQIRVNDELFRVTDDKLALKDEVTTVKREVSELGEKADRLAEKAEAHKEKAKRHKKKHLRSGTELAIYKQRFDDLAADIDFYEDNMAILAGENAELQYRVDLTHEYLSYCKVTLKYKFKQWWTGIYHIDKLGEEIGLIKHSRSLRQHGSMEH